MDLRTSMGFPRQKVSSAEKNWDWRKRSVDGIVGSNANFPSGYNRTSRQEKQLNYNLVSGNIDQEDFEHILDPFGVGDEFGGSPAKLEDHNIVRANVALLEGEEANRPFRMYVRGVSGEVVNIRTEESRNMLLQYMRNEYLKTLGNAPDVEERIQSLPAIQKYMNTEFMDPREVTANQLVRFFTRHGNLQSKFNTGWKHALIVAEEIYYLGIEDGHPTARVVDPRNAGFDMDADAQYIEDGFSFWEERSLSPNRILDLFGEDLTDEEIDRIEKGDVMHGGMNGVNQMPGMVYDVPTYPFDGADAMNSFGIPVTTVAWRSMEKVGFLKYFDVETMQWLETMVDDSFKMTKEMKREGATVKWIWKTQIWEGVRIGNDIYPYIRPLAYQIGKLPYVGHVYDATNTKPTSLVDLIKSYQHDINVIWWKIMSEVAKASGSKMIMDMAQIPKSHGISTEQWIYYWDKLNIAWINSMEETPDKRERSNFNQFRNVEMGVSQAYIVSLIQVLDQLRNEVEQITGLSAQRKAQVGASESATGVNTAVTQSSHITESLFRKHSEVKRNVYTMLLEIAKVAYEDGKMIQYVVDDSYYLQLKVDGNTFPDSHYGVFVVDGSRDFVAKNKLENYIGIALQQQTTRWSDAVKLVMSDSVSEFQTYLVNAENKREQMAQQQQQAAQESSERMATEKIAWEREKLDREDRNKQLDREADIRMASIKALGSADGPSDANANGVPDPIEEADLGIRLLENQQAILDADENRQIARQKEAREMAKQDTEARFKEGDLQLKVVKLQQDAASFKREQAQQDRKNAADLQIKKADLSIKMKELADKDKDRAMKIKEMAFKEKELKMKERIEKFKVKNKPKPAKK